MKKEGHDYVDLVIIRVRCDGSTAMAKPCADCVPCIKMEKRVRYVFYTNQKGVLVKERAMDMYNSHKCSARKALESGRPSWSCLDS